MTNPTTVERARAEEALRRAEERQAFLLSLSDALRPLANPGEIQRVAARLIREHLGVANANYAQIDTDQGVYRLFDFAGVTRELTAGVTMAVAEVATDPRLRQEDRAACAANDVAMFLMTPLVKNGRLTANSSC